MSESILSDFDNWSIGIQRGFRLNDNKLIKSVNLFYLCTSGKEYQILYGTQVGYRIENNERNISLTIKIYEKRLSIEEDDTKTKGSFASRLIYEALVCKDPAVG